MSGSAAPSHPSLSEWLLLRCVAEIFSTLKSQLVPDVLACAGNSYGIYAALWRGACSA